MSDSSLHPLGSADASGYFTGRPSNREPVSEPEEEEPFECSKSESEVSSREVVRENPRPTPPPVSPQPPRDGIRSRATARMSVAPPVRSAIRDFPPGTGPAGSRPTVPVQGYPIARDFDLTHRTARRVDMMIHEVNVLRARSVHQGQNMEDMAELSEQMCYRLIRIKEDARAAMFWVRMLAMATLLLAVMLIWAVWIRG